MEWDYKIQPDSDHVAKFQGDRSRELGERVAKKERKKKIHHGLNISPSGTAVPGGLMNVEKLIRTCVYNVACPNN